MTPTITIQMISAAVYKIGQHNKKNLQYVYQGRYRKFSKRHLDDVYSWKSQSFKEVEDILVAFTIINIDIK